MDEEQRQLTRAGNPARDGSADDRLHGALPTLLVVALAAVWAAARGRWPRTRSGRLGEVALLARQ
jgi:hypothetical protein